MTNTYPEDNAGAPQAQGAGDVRETLAKAGETVKAEAAHFAEAAREKATGKIENRQAAVGDALADFADVIRKAGEELGERDQGFAARMVGQAAEGLQTFSSTISNKRPEEMLHAVRDFGRANPTAFLAGAVLAGLAIGRFARSSAEHEHGEGRSNEASYMADPDPGVPLDTYETPGAADPYAADLASGLDQPGEDAGDPSLNAGADPVATGLEDIASTPPTGEPSPDAGFGSPYAPKREF